MHVPSQYIISTTEESKALDRQTSEEFGIDAFTLMEVAGRSAAEVIEQSTKPGNKGLFLCGKGNNGGDALAAARYLSQKGIEVTIAFVAGRDERSPLAGKNEHLFREIANNDSSVSINFVEKWEAFSQSQSFDFVVDGMLGTGLNSELRGDILKAVRWVNKQPAPCFAMDIPTGLHADSGKVMGEAVRAEITFAFGTLKQGFYLNDGFKCRGEIYFCELPFPDYLKKSTNFLMDESYLSPLKRVPAVHKYAGGVVYIIGGSEGLTGAAIMAAKSAWATGVGAVIVVCPNGLLPIYENHLPEMIKKPIGESDDLFFKQEHVDEALSISREKEGTVLIGPGLGRDNSTVEFVTRFLKKSPSDCIIDADALWAVARQDKWSNLNSSSRIFTPHPGELKTLLKKSVDDDQKRLERVREEASQKKVTILSKGFPVIIGTKEGKTYISGYDSRYFSRAGFGDVLAGKVSGFKALGLEDTEACIRALIAGEKKMDRLLKENPAYFAEPKDII